jgi:hypothetical protein
LSSKIPVLFLEHKIYISVYENPQRPTRCLYFGNAMELYGEVLVTLWPTHNPEENLLYTVGDLGVSILANTLHIWKLSPFEIWRGGVLC